MIQKLFCSNIRALRRDRGLTQADVAAALELDQATYNRWESGKVWPPPGKVDALASLLEVEAWRLYSDPSKVDRPEPAPRSIIELAQEITRQQARIHELESQKLNEESQKIDEITQRIQRLDPIRRGQIERLLDTYERGQDQQSKLDSGS